MALVKFAVPLLAVSLGLSVQLAIGADKAPLSTVADLRYGVALYEYYQGHHLDALSELMVAEQKGGIQGHGDNPELMAGGFYLAYGMERTATDIFNRLLAENRPLRTRDAAWFHLARLRYLRGDWGGANEALQRISENPAPPLTRDVQALRVNLFLRQGDIATAEGRVTEDLAKSSWAPYLFYNIGAAYSRAGEFDKAIGYYNRLQKMTQRSDEYLALYDKAMTAAGYSHLLARRYPEAVSQFSLVRLDSPVSNRALLGYGWAAAEQQDYQAALKPWQVLAKRPLVDASTQEALVAIPYAYEKLGMAPAALRHFREAEANFEAEIATLEEVVSQLQGEAILQALEIDGSDDINWLNYAQNNRLTPQLSYLTGLFAREEFHGRVQELRDLMAIQANTRKWQKRMLFYNDMLDEREINRDNEMEYWAARQPEQKLAAMTATRDRLAAEIQRIEGEEDFFALARDQEAKQLARIRRAERNLERLQRAGEATESYEDRLRRYRGLLLWQAADVYPERLANAHVDLERLDAELADLRQRQQDIVGIIETGFDLQPYREQIGLIRNRLDRQEADIDRAVDHSTAALRDQLVEVLEAQKSRLHQYLAQSRLAIARLLDQAGEDHY